MGRRRALGLAAGTLVLAGALLVAASPSALAHALVRSSDPADGALLQTSPSTVTITFTERPDPALSSIHVLDSTGRPREAGEPRTVSGKPLELQVAVSSLPDGVYTVTWRTVSKVDGHVTAGSFSFGVGVSPGQTQGAVTGTRVPTTPRPSVLSVIGKWTFYWGLALLLGAWVIALLDGGGRLELPRWLLAAAWGLAAIGLAIGIVAERSTVGVSFSGLFRSTPGRQLLWQGVGVAVVAWPVLALLWRGATAIAYWTLSLTVAGTMLLHAMAGHAAASLHFAWFDVTVQWIHIVAVAIWVGGLVWLLVTTPRMEGEARASFVSRYSRLAGLALLVVAATGVQRAVSEVGGFEAWRRLVDTSFGVTLLVKIGLFAGLVALGARNRYVNVPRIQREGAVSALRRAVGAEVVLAAGVLGATAVLTGLPPASSVAAATARPVALRGVVATGADFGTTVRVRLSVTPGTAGPNAFRVTMTDYDTGRAIPASGVTLTFSLPGHPELGTPTLQLRPAGAGVWAGQGTDLSFDGSWDVSVLVQRTNGAVTVPLTVQTRLLPEQIKVIPGGPGQPALYTITLASGRSLQTYIDPGSPGPDTVHFTFFQASGTEQPIASASATAAGPDGSRRDLTLIRFDPGHFGANVNLTAGSWRFQIQASAPTGEVYSGYFTQSIGT